MKNRYFFAIEGLDGVGKTTLSENLEKEGFNVYKTPPKLYYDIRKDIHDLKESSFFYYLSSIAYTIEEETKDQNIFFLDRYLFSSVAQYISKNHNPTFNDFEDVFNKVKSFFILPNITFFITLDYETRVKRMKNRTQAERQLDNLDKKYHDFWVETIARYDFSEGVILDGKKSEAELLEDVKKTIKEFEEKTI